jgi:hypothetical protein
MLTLDTEVQLSLPASTLPSNKLSLVANPSLFGEKPTPKNQDPAYKPTKRSKSSSSQPREQPERTTKRPRSEKESAGDATLVTKNLACANVYAESDKHLCQKKKHKAAASDADEGSDSGEDVVAMLYSHASDLGSMGSRMTDLESRMKTLENKFNAMTLHKVSEQSGRAASEVATKVCGNFSSIMFRNNTLTLDQALQDLSAGLHNLTAGLQQGAEDQLAAQREHIQTELELMREVTALLDPHLSY